MTNIALTDVQFLVNKVDELLASHLWNSLKTWYECGFAVCDKAHVSKLLDLFSPWFEFMSFCDCMWVTLILYKFNFNVGYFIE